MAGRVGSIEETVDLRHTETPRNTEVGPRSTHQICGAFTEPALQLQVAVEAPEARRMTIHTGTGEPAVVEPGKVVAEVAGGQTCAVAACKPTREVTEISTVGLLGVGCQCTLVLHVVEEAVDQQRHGCRPCERSCLIKDDFAWPTPSPLGSGRRHVFRPRFFRHGRQTPPFVIGRPAQGSLASLS